MASIPLAGFQSLLLQPIICKFKPQVFGSGVELRAKWSIRNNHRFVVLKVLCTSDDKVVRNGTDKESENSVQRLQGTVNSLTPLLFVMRKHIEANFAVGLCIAVALMVICVRTYLTRKSRSNHHGSVADLVKRGQLRSDRRGISRPLKYDDPFNNPLVKISKSNSTVEMCGKVYRLAPVTLTKVEQSNHQKRRSRAYQWKRPTIFLKEGDSIPPDVDPDTIRWIPANHPFATTVNDIDEDLAQSNVYQKRGVPFRIKAEHEALQKKLETLQNEQKLNKMVIDPGNVRDFERPFKSTLHSNEKTEDRSNGRTPNSNLEKGSNASEAKTSFDELQKP